MKDLTGQKFGRLTALKPTEKRRNNCVVWLCKCECGNYCEKKGSDLVRGSTRSCGCLLKETSSQLPYKYHGNRTHGMGHTRIYYIWSNMKDRCFRPACKNYKNYGGRGITVCPEWKNSFEAFYDHVSKLPHYGEEGRSIDRINNDGNYEPNNVRWATRKEQRNNQRKTQK